MFLDNKRCIYTLKLDWIFRASIFNSLELVWIHDDNLVKLDFNSSLIKIFSPNESQFEPIFTYWNSIVYNITGLVWTVFNHNVS